MEACSFQSQLLSVMEVLAKAAVAEINRRVDESCAVLRLEVSQSQRDIDLLKRKCEGMEAELRRSRIRARRRVFHPQAGGKFSPLVKVVLNKDKQSTDWDRRTQTPSEPQQCGDAEAATDEGPILIKEECSEEDNEAEERLMSEVEQLPGFEAPPTAGTDGFEDPVDPGALLSAAAAGGFDSFPERRPELVVKLEEDEEPDENAAPRVSLAMTDGVDAPLWTGGPGVSYAEPRFEQTPAAFSPHGALLSEDAGARVHSLGKSQAALMSAARAKRWARTFGCKRPQPDEGHGALSQINPTSPSLIPQQLFDYHRARSPSEDVAAPGPGPGPAPSAYGHGRPAFGLARRMRTPWRPGPGEKRFGCTYCDKSFMRFSQLKEHLRSHTGEKPYSCAQCGRSFTKQCNLIRHAVVHSGEKPYECSLCGKCFTQRSSLKSHQKTVH